MEPVTHVLTGACLSRTGLNRRAAYATAAMAIAAEFPDIDTLWGLRGPISGFQHHRGITHTFLGVPFEAALILLCFVLFDRLWRARDKAGGVNRDLETRRGYRATRAPVRWGTLYVLLLVALLSHLLLDYTNNYGLRPFLPFNDRWYAASIVFIFDPLLFLMLVGGLLLPFLFEMIGREVGSRRKRYIGSGWARAALAGVLLLWMVRYVEHGRAVTLAEGQSLRAPAELNVVQAKPEDTYQGASEPATSPPVYRPLLQPDRSLASPDPLSVFRWYTVTDYGPAYLLGTADTKLGSWSAGPTLQKPTPSPILAAAEASHLGHVYLDWSPMPELSVSDGVPNDFDGQVIGQVETYRTVNFSDPRFMGDVPILDRGDRSPLSGQVVVGPGGQIAGEALDGRYGR